MASFVDFISVWSEICKKCSIVILFWRHQIFSMFSLRGILVCSLEMLVLFSHRILEYRLISFRNAMQLYFLFFVTSSLFSLEVVVKIFDYFWKSNSLFSKFCVNCLLMFYFVYCNICALKDVSGTCSWTCSLVPLRVPEMCLWPPKTRKSLNFLRCIHVIDLVLKYGSDINEGNWLQLLFYFIVLMSVVASVIGMSFFQLCFRF